MTPEPDEALVVKELQEIVGRIQLVREEYKDAVADGAILDATEYEEASMFAEQAALRFRRAKPQLDPEDGEVAGRIEADLAALMQIIAEKGPVADEEALVKRLLDDVAKVNPSPVPPAALATRAAVARADFAIEAEQVAGGYRVGLVLEEPQTLYLRREDGSLEAAAPAKGDTHYVGVTLREARTQRFLPGAKIEVEISGVRTPLHQLWGEFQQYGGNAALAEGPLTVHVRPPAYARHGDMLAVYVEPATVELTLAQGEAGLAPVGEEPSPAAPDYDVGDDVLQGLAESRWKQDVGPYHVGFIAEAPEPYWTWNENGELDLQEVAEEHTHHLEIFLTEKGSHRIVPNAHVMLTLTPQQGGEPIEAMLHPLLSTFYHYGKTLTVPPGKYEVEVTVAPPSFGAFDPSVFTETVKETFEWQAEAR